MNNFWGGEGRGEGRGRREEKVSEMHGPRTSTVRSSHCRGQIDVYPQLFFQVFMYFSTIPEVLLEVGLSAREIVCHTQQWSAICACAHV